MHKVNESLINIATYIYEQLPEVFYRLAYFHKMKLTNSLSKNFNNTVVYGAFKGLKFTSDSHWGIYDRGNMIVGLYEQDVITELCKFKQKYKYFIDLGAADGYYGIGVLIANIFMKSICFEISQEGRDVIKKNAIYNSVEENITIYGEATYPALMQLDNDVICDSFLFIDIEGAEFDLLDEKMFKLFHKSPIFVEIHDWHHSDSPEKKKLLIENSSKTHSCKILKQGSRDLSQIPYISTWNDVDRWLLCSEGRDRLMEWYLFEPR